MSADDGAGTREVARRLFAAEYDDATLSYSESDEERAPNYVVTPTGARVNRLFAVGVLTAIESVNEDMLRARIVDPTGAFVAYAGQYQPDALAFFERATPPAFVALTAKARTFKPEDSERVFTSARPETVNEVDADTRDRWTVSAAEATLRRVSLFDAALSSGLRGDDLERHLREHGVEEALATGIPRAIDHYGTTTAYLDAVRRLALDALAVVAGDREDVRELSLAPDEGGAAALGRIPEDLRADGAIATPEATTGSAQSVAAETGDESVANAATDPAPDAADSPTPEAPTDSVSEAATESGSEAVTDSGSDAADVATAATDSDASPADSVETVEDTSTGDGAPTPDASPDADAKSDATVSDELGDFDDSLSGESDTDDAADDTASSDEPELDGTADADASTDATDVDVAEDDLYEFDEEEREAVRQEHGLSFESGADVDSPGEAGIETPDPGDSDAEPTVEETGNATDDDATVATATGDSAAGDAADEASSDAATDDTVSDDTATDDTATEEVISDDATPDDGAADVAEGDLTDAVVDVMDELDEGDGADREEVIAAVVQRHGSDPGAVEDAIQEALMDGQCYEPGEGRLKAI